MFKRLVSAIVLPAAIVALLGASAAWSAPAAPNARRCEPNCPKQGPSRAEFASEDEAFIAARNAVNKPDPVRFEQAAAQVSRSHPLSVYIDYWRLRLQLADTRSGSAPDAIEAADARARDFVVRHQGTIVGDLARRDWMNSLGRREAWSTYETVYPGWILKDEPGPRCYALRARLSRGEAVMTEARDVLMQPRDLGEACNGLLESLASSGQAHALDAPASRELTIIGLALLARNDPGAAAERMAPLASRLRPADRAWCWSQIAAGGMRKMLPESTAWAREARSARASDDTLAALTRASLRGTDWASVRSAIERMSESARSEPTWTYWLGRALQAQSDTPEGRHQARARLTLSAGRPEFYSMLAAEELGTRFVVPPKAAAPTPAELAAARANPGFDRAIRFYELGLRPEGNREWNFQLRTMTDRQLLAAAEYG
ncbi:MAG: hypothetical protein NTV17_02610, partial [Burkholderiales bacterium]|nr:hypothetical protein [Burkholderiales bacterium]